MVAFVLVHSPILGPVSWSLVAKKLSVRGFVSVTPDLDGSEADPTPLWQQHAASIGRAIRDLPTEDRPVLVAHSGAGALLPPAREGAGRTVGGYVFVDAGLPTANEPRKGSGEFARDLAKLHAQGRRFPDWTEADLHDITDPGRRGELLAELRPQPPRFWDESIPVFDGWPDAPCGYLRFAPNPAYDSAASEAIKRRWAYREVQAGHFFMLENPVVVADALLSLSREMETRAR